MRGKEATLDTDWLIVAVLDRQDRAISRAQLRRAGLSDDAIDRRLARGQLHIVHRGVFAAGHPRLSQRGKWWAAALAHPGGLISHRSNLHARGLVKWSRTAVDVLVTRRHHSTSGIQVRRTRHLRPCDVDDIDGLPATSVARALLDFAATEKLREVERACERAENDLELDWGPVHDLLSASPRAAGASRLRAILAANHRSASLTDSELEERFLGLVDQAGLPRPIAQHHTDEGRIDFIWPELGLIVEVDSWRYHRGRNRFDSDRARDAAHLAAGLVTARFTDRQIEFHPTLVIERLHAIHKRLRPLSRVMRG